ncbi:hypothetical protein ALQ42_200196 [Pseudomonas savastanoi pv. glycinea]|uniref:Uncharacterized protein n=1 Tax=Pseudomonas savastanoi pv. glycinea TaxID=318 RepID=A0A3M3U5I6_PSESG|nr:hypothetical protein ALQ42_200196 [Pseudomonas savastanoi pv. glycinea]
MQDGRIPLHSPCRRGSTSSAVVNQASREAVVLTLRASNPHACALRLPETHDYGQWGCAHSCAGYVNAPSPSPGVWRFEFPSTGAGAKGRRGALYITFR